ncbi:MAG TPA: hypothetical protein VNL16_14400 [Chloroflexota bacterium]|nr:hypothetical protein [Chloroflexota bacterium]
MPRDAVDPDPAVMRLDDLLAQVQPRSIQVGAQRFQVPPVAGGRVPGGPAGCVVRYVLPLTRVGALAHRAGFPTSR